MKGEISIRAVGRVFGVSTVCTVSLRGLLALDLPLDVQLIWRNGPCVEQLFSLT